MFEEDSQEKQGLLDEIARLKAELNVWESMPMVSKIIEQGNTINDLMNDIDAKTKYIVQLKQELELAKGGEHSYVDTINSLAEENRKLKVQLHL